MAAVVAPPRFPVAGRYINAPAETLKAVARAVIATGDPVWFGCDMGKYHHRDLGILDEALFDYEGVYGAMPSLTKVRAACVCGCGPPVNSTRLRLGLSWLCVRDVGGCWR